MSTTARIAATAVALALLAAPGAAPAATSCEFASTLMRVDLTAANDVAVLTRAPDGEISVAGDAGPLLCDGGTPTTSTTSSISVVSGPEATSAFVAIEGASLFAPGVGTADEQFGTREIEIFVNLRNHPRSALRVADDRAAGASLRFGTVGINTNAFPSELVPDADIFLVNVPGGVLSGAGGAGPDTISAQGGAGTGDARTDGVFLQGLGGADSLAGGAGADALLSDHGNDVLSGAGGGDWLDPGPDDDVIDGGPGPDWAVFRSDAGVSVDLASAAPQAMGDSGSDSLAGIENVAGTEFSDVLRGDGGSNTLAGGSGDDTLEGRDGKDELWGNAGEDTVEARDGVADIADCGTDLDTVIADLSGVDVLTGCETGVFPVVDGGGDWAPAGGGDEAPAAGGADPDRLAPSFLGRVRVRRTRVRYSLSEAATVTFVIERRIRRRFVRIGAFRARAAAGPNAKRFSGRLGKRRLKPGSYRAVLTAVDAAGNASTPATVRFAVVKPTRASTGSA